MKRNIVENPVIGWIGNIADLVLLNLCWLVCSLPVVTAGASAAAMFHASSKLARGEKWRLREDFFLPFRRDMALSLRLWLPLLAFEGFIGFDLWYGGHTDKPWITALAVAAGTLWCMAAVWSFALLGRFQYARAQDVLHDALALSIANLPISLIAVFLTLWVPAALLLFPAFLSGILPAVLLLDGSLSALILSALMGGVFRKIEGQDTASEQNEEHL